MGRLRQLTGPGVALLLLGVVVSFWYWALVVPADLTTVTMLSVDLYHEHYPFAKYAGEQLAQGRLPLWNPYQLNGLPFLAVPHSGVFYPPNLIYLWSNTGVATELSLIFHWLFAGIGLWLLIRAWGMGHLAGIAAATSFMLSRWLIGAIQWPVIVACTAWLPWTLLAIEMVFRKKSWAPIALALSVAFQIFNGATEFVVYNGYASALYVILRSIPILQTRDFRLLASRGVLLLAAVVLGVGLSAVQMLPTLELLSQSGRMAEGTDLAFARGDVGAGFLPVTMFLKQIWAGKGMAALGILPLLGLVFFPREREARLPWIFALTLGVVAILLISGGAVFELYFETPLGRLFRRPTKFFYYFNFAEGIIAAYAVTRLLTLRDEKKLFSFYHVTWAIATAACIGWVGWLVWNGDSRPYLFASVALVIIFGLAKHHSVRTLICIALCGIQIAALFSIPRNPSMRPFKKTFRFDIRGDLLNELRDVTPGQRIFASTSFIFEPALMPKQGMLRGAFFATDYEPLATERQANYFVKASRTRRVGEHFSGHFILGEQTRWTPLDCASLRYYIARRFVPEFAELRRLAEEPQRTGVRLYEEDGWLEVLERTQALPRAYFVSEALAFDDPDELLEVLGAGERFRPHAQVLLETSEGAVTLRNDQLPDASVEIRTPDPETVVLDVSTDQPGYVVLTDTWYPGWHAAIDGKATKIYHANYLFRAVKIDAGSSTIQYRYAPESLYIGAGVSGASLLAIMLLCGWFFFRSRDEYDTE